jgi:hypothetical protein
VWGTVAHQGLCLGGVDDDELTRFSKTALRKMSVVGHSACALAVVASGFVAGDSYLHVAGLSWWTYYLPAGRVGAASALGQEGPDQISTELRLVHPG